MFKFGRKGIDAWDTVPGSQGISQHDNLDRRFFGTNVMANCPRQHNANRGGNDYGTRTEVGYANQ